MTPSCPHCGYTPTGDDTTTAIALRHHLTNTHGYTRLAAQRLVYAAADVEEGDDRA